MKILDVKPRKYMVLAVELEQFFLTGTENEKKLLYQLLAELQPRLIYVSETGIENLRASLPDLLLQTPEFIIADAGATVLNGHTFSPIEPVQRKLSINWPGSMKVMEALKGIAGLEYQGFSQRNRCSFSVKSGDIISAIQDRLREMPCDIETGQNNIINILPRGVNRVSTCSLLLQYAGWQQEPLLTTLNALVPANQFFLHQTITASNFPAFQDDVEKTPRHYRPSSVGAAALVEALYYFGLAKAK